MTNERLQTVLFEGARILLSGVAIALLITGAMSYFDRPSLADFEQEYMAADAGQQVLIAENYLKHFSVAELTGQINGGSVDGVCHVQSHSIGRAVYKMTSNFSEAIRKCGDACTYGCFHGAMMEMFQTESDTLGGVVEGDTPEQYLERVRTVAPDLCWKPEVAGQVSGRSCTHGLGHSFMILTADLDEAIRACTEMKDRNAIDSCRAGVFMEYLFDPSSVNALMSKGTQFCDRYPSDTEACFQYKAYGWVRSSGAGARALEMCESFGKNTEACIRAVSRAATEEDFADRPDKIDALCAGVDANSRPACLAGAYMKLFDLYNIDDSDRVCEKADAAHTDSCWDALTRYRQMYTFEREI